MKVFLQFLFFLIDRTMFVMRREIFLHFWSFFFVFNSINCDESKKKPNVSIISTISSNIFFQEQFQNESQWSKWIRSEAKRDGVDEHIAQYDGHWAFEIPSVSIYNDDFGLVLKSKGRHYAIGAAFQTPFDFSVNSFIVQYEVKFETNQECGGAYVKLLSQIDQQKINLKYLTDKTPYTIMFGPDMCGSDHKFHFILRYRHPKTGRISEHQAKKTTESLSAYFTDKKTHLYKLVLSSDNTFKMFIDGKLINSGNLLKDLEPAILPQKEILDPNDQKPIDWDDEEKIVDPSAKKPDDWDEDAPKEIIDQSAQKPQGWLEDEPLMILDPEATKPEDWDDEIDGKWEPPEVENPRCRLALGCGRWTPPMIPNPNYKGKWSPPMIDNPNYRGQWEPRLIANPDFFDDPHPYHRLTTIGALALEIWSTVDGVIFDNFLVTSDDSIAKKYADQLWSPKYILEEKQLSPAATSTSTTTTSTTTNKSSSTIDSLIETVKTTISQKPWILLVSLGASLLPWILFGLYYLLQKRKGMKTSKKMKKSKPVEEIDGDEDEDQDYEDEEKEEEEERSVSSKSKRKTELNNPKRQPTPMVEEKIRRRNRKK